MSMSMHIKLSLVLAHALSVRFEDRGRTLPFLYQEHALTHVAAFPGIR